MKSEDKVLRYYVGIDGGATKTAVCATSVDDGTLRYTNTSGSSWREHGVWKVAQNLKNAVVGLMGEDYGRIAGIAMGLPCHGESPDGDSALERAIRGVFSGVSLYLTNDVEAGWAGSMALEPGINIVAGTGSIAFGKDSSGQTARSGGWRAFFGDEGSCYWIGRKVMELFSKQSDGRLPKDELYTTVCREFNLQNDFSFIDLIHTEYVGYRKQVASLQFLAEKAALEGSPSAKALYEEAVHELILLVTAIRNRLDFTEKPWSVSYSGGLFKAEKFVLEQFSKEIEKAGGKLSTPCFAPVEGAVLLAFQHFCPDGLKQIKKLMVDKKLTRESRE
jgi:N-acetylglucosamine kinase-like BadF-type ATPase